MPAPDYVEPIVGWRCWAAAWVEGELRLCSPVYELVWPLRDHVHAECRDSTLSAQSRRPPAHAAPAGHCRCGIYAVDYPKRALSFIRGQGPAAAPGEVVAAVLGRVYLWGKVIECDNGWRAEYAYPAELYLSANGRGGATSRFRRRVLDDRKPELEEIARLLRSYRAPVHIASDSLADVAGALED